MIVEDELLISPAKTQAQGLAVPLEDAVGFGGQINGLIGPIDQLVPGQWLSVELAPGPVKAPVFGNANPGIDLAFRDEVLLSRAFRGDFQREVGGLPNLPW